MITAGASDLALAEYVRKMWHVESLMFYDRDLYWIAQGPDGRMWLGVWQDTDWAPLPARDQEAFFEIDDAVTLLKEKPIVEVLAMAKSVLIHDYYFTPYVQEPGRTEVSLVTTEKYMEEATSTEGLPKSNIMLFD